MGICSSVMGQNIYFHFVLDMVFFDSQGKDIDKKIPSTTMSPDKISTLVLLLFIQKYRIGLIGLNETAVFACFYFYFDAIYKLLSINFYLLETR